MYIYVYTYTYIYMYLYGKQASRHLAPPASKRET